jgi:PPOX class probable F420-dependent enzyme
MIDPRTALRLDEAEFVQHQRIARLATADLTGTPHLVPVCYAFDGVRFYTPLDEKPKRVADQRLRRVRNIQASSRVALLVDRYDEDWSHLAWVLVHGQAELLAAQDEGHERALALLRERYQQYGSMALELRPVIAITPTRVVSWGDLSETRGA